MFFFLLTFCLQLPLDPQPMSRDKLHVAHHMKAVLGSVCIADLLEQE
jgi:hypothetical protein